MTQTRTQVIEELENSAWCRRQTAMQVIRSQQADIERLRDEMERIASCRLKDGDMMVDIANIVLRETSPDKEFV